MISELLPYNTYHKLNHMACIILESVLCRALCCSQHHIVQLITYSPSASHLTTMEGLRLEAWWTSIQTLMCKWKNLLQLTREAFPLLPTGLLTQHGHQFRSSWDILTLIEVRSCPTLPPMTIRARGASQLRTWLVSRQVRQGVLLRTKLFCLWGNWISRSWTAWKRARKWNGSVARKPIMKARRLRASKLMRRALRLRN